MKKLTGLMLAASLAMFAFGCSDDGGDGWWGGGSTSNPDHSAQKEMLVGATISSPAAVEANVLPSGTKTDSKGGFALNKSSDWKIPTGVSGYRFIAKEGNLVIGANQQKIPFTGTLEAVALIKKSYIRINLASTIVAALYANDTVPMGGEADLENLQREIGELLIQAALGMGKAGEGVTDPMYFFNCASPVDVEQVLMAAFATLIAGGETPSTTWAVAVAGFDVRSFSSTSKGFGQLIALLNSGKRDEARSMVAQCVTAARDNTELQAMFVEAVYNSLQAFKAAGVTFTSGASYPTMEAIEADVKTDSTKVATVYFADESYKPVSVYEVTNSSTANLKFYVYGGTSAFNSAFNASTYDSTDAIWKNATTPTSLDIAGVLETIPVGLKGVISDPATTSPNVFTFTVDGSEFANASSKAFSMSLGAIFSGTGKLTGTLGMLYNNSSVSQ